MSLRRKKIENELPAQKYGDTIKRELLNVDGKTSIVTTYENDSSMSFFIGAVNRFCAYMFIQKDLPVAHIMKIYYDTNCYTSGNFQRKQDSGKLIPMIAEIMRERYPYVKTLKFTDTSRRDCLAGRAMSLAEMKYLTTGKTWYQEHYNAYLSPSDKAIFDKNEAAFQQKKAEMSWTTLRQWLPAALPMEEQSMSELFTSTKTWQEFFKGILDKVGYDTMCSFLVDWPTEFLMMYLDFRFSKVYYYIDIESVPTITIQMLPYSSAGSRRKRTTQRVRQAKRVMG